MPPEDRLTFTGPLSLATTGTRREYRARLIRAGTIRAQGNRPSKLRIPTETLQDAQARGLFDARPTFVDHPGLWERPSLRNLAGLTLTNSEWNAADGAVDATIRLYDTEAGTIIDGLLGQMLADAQDGGPIPDIGLSAVLWAKWKAERAEDGEGITGWRMDSIYHVESVDFVFEPGADGRVKEALTALAALPADLGAEPPAPAEDIRPQAVTLDRHSAVTPMEESTMPPENSANEAQQTAAPAESPPEPETAQIAGSWLHSLAQSATEQLLRTSDLPQAARDYIRGLHLSTPEAVGAAIEAQRAVLASAAQDHVIQVGGTPPRSSGISVGRTSLEQVSAAFEALIAGTNPPAGVQPLTGIREMYHLLSGDYDMHGLFHGDNVYLANVTSATMANITANVLNKVVVNAFQTYPRWWEPICYVEDFSNLQQIKWITMGGVGELPTVAEGAAYTELTWDDLAETDDFVKKGGYLGLTLEAIDKDDTRKIRLAPRALAQAAWLTLSKSVSAIFTDNSGTGPVMTDTGYLFNATAVSTTGGHANLLTTALSWSEYIVVRTAMMKQVEHNSGERLGFLTAPRYLLVPIDLEITALQILASEGKPGTANNDENPLAVGDDHSARMSSARERVIVVPLWTDTNNWAAVADPKLYPSIGLGFRYGRTPEIFSVASPTAGLMFTNDTMPVKVRFFYAVGPTDYRGLHKSNV